MSGVALMVALRVYSPCPKQQRGKLMELKDFVSEALKQIVSGVKEAQIHAKEEGALINPHGFEPMAGTAKENLLFYRGHGYGKEIEFDVALTTSERDQVEGGVGVLLSVFGAGVKGIDTIESATVSRVKFSVPIFLPQQK